MINMEYNFIIEKININDVNNNSEKYNSNNHWTDNKRPVDYLEKIELNNTKNWINNFHDPDKIHKIIINDKNVLTWMKSAERISHYSKKFSKLAEEDLTDFIEKNKDKYPFLNGTSMYFVRTESVSLKYGQHGIGPYKNLKEIIESICTCPRGHNCIDQLTKEIIIYLFPWINIEAEYRVFVYNEKITCISQQNLYSIYSFDDEVLIKHLKLIYDYFETHIKNNLLSKNTTIDIGIINNNSLPYFIELNSFGKEYASGSGLFHWILDEDKLYSNGKEIYVRITTK